jgi:hypothetical protein
MMIVSAKDLQNPEVQREMRVRFPGLDVIHMDKDPILCRPPACYAPAAILLERLIP